MACFIAPVTEAIVTTIVKKKMDKKGETKNPFIMKMNWLNNMLWGGSALLAFEHVWHGEVTLAFPFLTGGAGTLHEILTSGIAMAALVTVVWAGMVWFTNALEKDTSKTNAPLIGGQR